MPRLVLLLSTLFVLLSAAPSVAADWRAGVGRVDVTPEEPVWLAGYAARTEASRGVAGPILAKALALEDASGRRLVIVTCDLLTMPRPIADTVARRLGERFRLPRARILLVASHSHSAPVIEDRLLDMYFLDGERLDQVRRYTRRVEEALFEAGREALESLETAEVFAGSGEAGFAINRRRRNPDDPVDHEVPVLRVDFAARADSERERRRAVLFAYACHNTTLDGLDVCGDYAGFAQEELESRHPGLTALFAPGCAGDQNPDPRRTMELARQHGKSLADAVTAVLSGSMNAVASDTGAAFGRVPLRLVPAPSRTELETRATSENRYARKLAERLLERIDAGGEIAGSYPFTAQVWRFGEDRFLIALAGEVVVDYALRLKREVLPAEAGGGHVAVLAYANDVPAYIPSERVLEEGGYEGGGAMVYYGFHGPWAAGVEMTVIEHVLRLAEASRRPSPLVAKGQRLVKLWDEGEFTEGPALGPDGAVYFTDIPNNRILRFAGGETSVFRASSGKANGLLFDREGRLLAVEGADGGNRRVTRTEKDGSVRPLAETFGGKRFNSPNDLTIDLRGRVYFSDPRYSGDEPRELESEAVYRWDPATGEVERAIDGLVKPNGVAVSPDGATLYVSDAGAAKLYAFGIPESGLPVRERLVYDFGTGRGIDGMECGPDGIIYGAAGRGDASGVYAVAPDGTLVDFIPTPETATNCCFGPAGRELFITAGKSLYRVELAARPYEPW